MTEAGSWLGRKDIGGAMVEYGTIACRLDTHEAEGCFYFPGFKSLGVNTRIEFAIAAGV